MFRTFRVFVVAATFAVAIAACGGGSSTSLSAGGQAQSKELHRYGKAISTDYQSLVQELYMAYFGRPADPTGIVNFENALLNANAPTDIQALIGAYSANPAVKALVDSFETSPESVRLYGGVDNNAFVTSIFLNVLGRAPQSQGLKYWVTALDNNSLTRGDAALSIMAGALVNTSSQGVIDGELIANRLGVAENFTLQISLQNAVGAYAGAIAATAARNMLSAVSASTDVSEYQITVNAIVASLANQSTNNQSSSGFVTVYDGFGSAAVFYKPSAVAVDNAGNIYVAIPDVAFGGDQGSSTDYDTIRKITPDGVVTTLAGSGYCGSDDGVGAAASFCNPQGIAVDSGGNLYVANFTQNTIRKVSPAGLVTTFAGKAGYGGSEDGKGSAARFCGPSAIALDVSGNLYVTDAICNVIRKITPDGTVTTLAGNSHVVGYADGTGSSASFRNPSGVTVDKAGNVYVADSGNNIIRKITASGVVTTFAGKGSYLPNGGSIDGVGSAASFNSPAGLTIDVAGNLYVADFTNNEIRKITPGGVVSTFAGSMLSLKPASADGIGPSAGFNAPSDVAADSSGNLYVADSGNNIIRKITPSQAVTTIAGAVAFAGNGTGSGAMFGSPQGVTTDSYGNVYVADTLYDTIRKISPSGVVTVLAGNPNTVSLPTYGSLSGCSSIDSSDGSPSFCYPVAIALDGAMNAYVIDAGTNTVRKINKVGVVSTLAGRAGVAGYADGVGSAASFNFQGVTPTGALSVGPSGIAVDATGNVFVTDTLNSTIRKITPSGVVTTFAGSAKNSGNCAYVDGVGTAAAFCQPGGLAIDGAGNIYVADTGNSVVRMITPSGVVTTIAGSAGVYGWANGVGAAALFNGPTGLAIDSAGNIYVGDTNNDVVRKISTTHFVSTIAGLLPTGGAGACFTFCPPSGVAVDSAGNVFVADSGDDRIVKISSAGNVSIFAGQ